MTQCERNEFCNCNGSCRPQPVVAHCRGFDKMSPEGKQAVVAVCRAAAAMLSPAQSEPLWVRCSLCLLVQDAGIRFPALLGDADVQLRALTCQRCGAKSKDLTLASKPTNNQGDVPCSSTS